MVALCQLNDQPRAPMSYDTPIIGRVIHEEHVGDGEL